MLNGVAQGLANAPEDSCEGAIRRPYYLRSMHVMAIQSLSATQKRSFLYIPSDKGMMGSLLWWLANRQSFEHVIRLSEVWLSELLPMGRTRWFPKIQYLKISSVV